MKDLFRVGNKKYIKGDYKGAIKLFSKLIEVEPNNIYAYINLGIAKMDLGNYDIAIDYFTKAIDLDPENADAYKNRALAYYSIDKEEKALLDYKKSTQFVQTKDTP